MLGEMGANHTYVDENGTTQTILNYGDCGEAFLRCWINLGICDPATRTFLSSRLIKAFPKVTPKLIVAYDGNPNNPTAYKQQSYDAVNDGIEGRTVFGDVFANLNQPSSNQEANDVNVVYGKADRCSIEVGLNNILAVFEKIFNDPDLSNIRRQEANEEANGDIRRAKMVSYILQRFSRDDFVLSWHINGLTDTIGNFQDYTLTINGLDSFACHISKGHFDFLTIVENKAEDWRKDPKLLKVLLASETLNPSLKAHLIPFYLSNANAHALSNEPIKTQAKIYANDIFYGSNMSTAQDKYQTFHLGLTLGSSSALKLLSQWLNKCGSDVTKDSMSISLLFKHRSKLENNTSFWETLDGRIKSLYGRTIDQIKSGNIVLDFSAYLPHPYADSLMMAVLDTKLPQAIGSVYIAYSRADAADEQYSFLVASVYRGQIDLTRYLLDRACQEVLREEFITTRNPLDAAAHIGSTELMQMLLAVKREGEELPLLLSSRC